LIIDVKGWGLIPKKLMELKAFDFWDFGTLVYNHVLQPGLCHPEFPRDPSIFLLAMLMMGK